MATDKKVAERKKKGIAGGLYRKWLAREGRFMWLGQAIIGGHKHRTKPCLTKSEAQHALNQLKVDVRQKKRITERIPFTQFADEFLEHARLVNQNYESHVHRLKHLKPFFKGKKLDEITKADVYRYIEGRLKAGRTKATVNRELACLKRLLNFALETGRIAVNPLARFPMLHEEERPVRSITEEEQERLLAFCRTSSHPAYQVMEQIILLSIHLGTRLSELMWLKWEKVDFESATIILGKTKAKKVRLLPVNRVAQEILLQLRAQAMDEYVIPFDRTGSVKYKFQHYWRELLKKVDLKIRFHDLRATFATRLDRKGASAFTIRQLLGHSTLDITRRYIGVDEAARRAVETLTTGHEIRHDSEPDIGKKPQVM